MSGTVVNHDLKSGRYCVLLAATQERVSFKSDNMFKYAFDPATAENCNQCKELIKLFAFPPCACSIKDVASSGVLNTSQLRPPASMDADYIAKGSDGVEN